MSEHVLANLPRSFTWRDKTDDPELQYGPGLEEIPLGLAQALKEMGFITEWKEGAAASEWTTSKTLSPSTELAANFPSREYLYMAGHFTYGNVSELTSEQLDALPGIGPARLKALEDALKEVRKRLPAEAPPSEPESAPSQKDSAPIAEKKEERDSDGSHADA
jgi:hypothetical protein